MRDRRSEQRHDGVADELLHRPAEALELGTEMGVVGLQHGLDVLRVESLRASGEPHEVGEEDRDDLPLRARARPRLAQCSPALRAELGFGIVLVAAGWASAHRGKGKRLAAALCEDRSFGGPGAG